MKRVCLGLLQNLGMRRATSPKTNAAKKIPSTRVEVNNKKHTVQNKSDDFCGETINTRSHSHSHSQLSDYLIVDNGIAV